MRNSSSRSIGNAAITAQNASIAFPAISTGIFGYPLEAAAHIAIATVRDHDPADTAPDLVRFVCFDLETQRIYARLLAA